MCVWGVVPAASGGPQSGEQSRCGQPRLLGPYLEGVVHVEHPAVQDGGTHGGDPQRPALPQRPPPGAHRLARETGYDCSLLLAGTSGHEGLRLHHRCPGQHWARGAVVDLGEDWDHLACSGERGWGRSVSPSAALTLALFPSWHPSPGTWCVALSVDLGREGDKASTAVPGSGDFLQGSRLRGLVG